MIVFDIIDIQTVTPGKKNKKKTQAYNKIYENKLYKILKTRVRFRTECKH